MAIIKVRNPAIDLDAAEIPNLPASKITSGTFDNARISLDAAEIPNLDTAKITTGTLADARVPNLNASKITAGTIATARLGSGTANSSTFLRGDNTFAEAGGGIENVDQFSLPDATYGDTNIMNGSWARNTTLNGLPHGTGLSVSSGVFTFPQTGLYKIDFLTYIYKGTTVSYSGPKMQGTSDGFSSNEQDLSLTYGSIPVNAYHINIYSSAIYEISNTSNNKFRVKINANTDCGYYQTKLTFVRLADA